MLKIFAFAICAPLAYSAMAEPQPPMFNWDHVTAGVNLGSLGGKTSERAYSPAQGGRKVSQLDWRYSNAAVIQGSLEWSAMPWFSLGTSGWTTFTRKEGRMDDYDWQSASQNGWTDHSSHPNTHLNFSNQFDIHATGWIFKYPEWRMGVMAGYQESRFSFNSRGGSYSYNNGANTGTFAPNVMSIGYKQRFSVPYIGVTGQYRYRDFEIGGTFKYSAWARVTGNDEHYLRTLTFTDKSSGQDYFSLAANVGYYVSENVKVYVEGTWNRATNKKTNVNVNNYRSGVSTDYRDAGGIENYNFLTTAGVKYTF